MFLWLKIIIIEQDIYSLSIRWDWSLGQMLLLTYDEVAYNHCYQCWILHYSVFGCGPDRAPAPTRHNHNLINTLMIEHNEMMIMYQSMMGP